MFFLLKRFWVSSLRSTSVRRVGFCIIAGIALGVAALMVTLGVANGFEREYKKGLQHFNAHILVLPDHGLRLSKKVLSKTLGEKAVRITPYLHREALLIHKGKITGIVLKGVEESFEGIRIGASLAKTLGIEGGEVKLLLPDRTNFRKRETRKLAVNGTFSTGMYEFDSQFAMVSLKTLASLSSNNSSRYGYEILLKDPEEAESLGERLEEELGPFISVRNWIELNRPLFEAIRLEKWAFRILMGFMIFAASLNLISALLLSIFRKTGTLSVLKVLGLSPKKIRLLFAGEGLLLGSIGLSAGLLIGRGLIYIFQHASLVPIDPSVYFLDRLPLDLPEKDIFIIAVFTLLLIGITVWMAARGALTIPMREGLHRGGN